MLPSSGIGPAVPDELKCLDAHLAYSYPMRISGSDPHPISISHQKINFFNSQLFSILKIGIFNFNIKYHDLQFIIKLNEN